MKLTDNQKIILRYIKDSDFPDAQTISEMLNIRLIYVKKALEKLSENGLIEYTESDNQPMKRFPSVIVPHIVRGWKVKPSFYESWSSIISDL